MKSNYEYKYILCQDKWAALSNAVGGKSNTNFKLILEQDLENEKDLVPVDLKDFENTFLLVRDLAAEKLSFIQESELVKNSSRYELLTPEKLLSWEKENLGQGYIDWLAISQNDKERFNREFIPAMVKAGRTDEQIKKTKEAIIELSRTWKFAYTKS